MAGERRRISEIPTRLASPDVRKTFSRISGQSAPASSVFRKGGHHNQASLFSGSKTRQSKDSRSIFRFRVIGKCCRRRAKPVVTSLSVVYVGGASRSRARPHGALQRASGFAVVIDDPPVGLVANSNATDPTDDPGDDEPGGAPGEDDRRRSPARYECPSPNPVGSASAALRSAQTSRRASLATIGSCLPG